MSLVCVNTSNTDELVKIIGIKNANEISKFIEKNGYINKKEIINKIIGNSNYKIYKKSLYIDPPSTLLKINNLHDFLQELCKYNDNLINSKISQKISQIQTSNKSFGYVYILRRNADKYTKWYKVGMTRREPEVRAAEWNYELKFFMLTSNHKLFERLIHLYLNFAHCKREAIHGKGKYEVEWFHVNFNLIVKVIKTLIEIYDDKSSFFNKNNIKRIHDLLIL